MTNYRDSDFDYIKVIEEIDGFSESEDRASTTLNIQSEKSPILPRIFRFSRVLQLELQNCDLGQSFVLKSREEDRDKKHQLLVNYTHFLQIKRFQKEIKEIEIRKQIIWEGPKPHFLLVLKQNETDEPQHIFLWKSDWENREECQKEALRHILIDFYRIFRFNEKAIEHQVSLRMERIFFKSLKKCFREILAGGGDPHVDKEASQGLIESALRALDAGKLKKGSANLNAIVYETITSYGIFPFSFVINKTGNCLPLIKLVKKVIKKLYAPWTEKFHAAFIFGDFLYEFTDNDSWEISLCKNKIIYKPSSSYNIPVLDFFPLDFWVKEMADFLRIWLEGANAIDLFEKYKEKKLNHQELKRKIMDWAKSFMKVYKEAFDTELLIKISSAIADSEIKGYKLCKNNCQTALLKIIYYFNEKFSKYHDSIPENFQAPANSPPSSASSSYDSKEESKDQGGHSNCEFETQETSRWRFVWKSEAKIMVANKMLNYFGIWADQLLREFLNDITAQREKKFWKGKGDLRVLEDLLTSKDFSKLENNLLRQRMGAGFDIKDKICYLHFKLRGAYYEKRMELLKSKEFHYKLTEYENLTKKHNQLIIDRTELQKTEQFIRKYIKYYLPDVQLAPRNGLSNVGELIDLMNSQIRERRAIKRCAMRVFAIFAVFYYQSVRTRISLKLSSSYSFVGHLFVKDPTIEGKHLQSLAETE